MMRDIFVHIDDEYVKIGQAELDREAILGILNGATPAPPPTGTLIGPDDVQEAILDKAPGITLKSGFYEPFYVITGTEIASQEPGGAVVTAAKPFELGWHFHGDGIYSHEWTVPFHQHPAHQVHSQNGQPSERGLAHRRAQQPHMILLNGMPLQAVYSRDALKEHTFWLEGTAQSPKRIYAMFSDHPSNLDLKACYHQKLVYTQTDDVDGVVLEGLVLRYCANTGTQGALHLPPASDSWIVKNVKIEYSNGEGVIIQGNDHYFESVSSDYNGIAGFVSVGMHGCQLVQCQAAGNVWKHGIDPLWHAGGAKFTKSSNNTIEEFTALSNDGAGLWFDIYNFDNHVTGFTLANNMAFGCHIEHHTQNGTLVGGVISDTRKFNAGTHSVGSGLQIQGAVTGYVFKDITLTGNSDGAVYYKKREGRGASGNNVFDNILYLGLGNALDISGKDRWALQGDVDTMPDDYINMEMPLFNNWP